MEPGDGRAFGMMFAMKHLLRKLEAKGVLSHGETVAMLDATLEEMGEQTSGLEPKEAAAASRAVGHLYLPK